MAQKALCVIFHHTHALALWLHADLLRSALRVSQFHNYKGQHLASLILLKGPFVSIEEAVAKVKRGNISRVYKDFLLEL